MRECVAEIYDSLAVKYIDIFTKNEKKHFICAWLKRNDTNIFDQVDIIVIFNPLHVLCVESLLFKAWEWYIHNFFYSQVH